MLAELHAGRNGRQKVELKVELCISKDAETIAQQAVPVEPSADFFEQRTLNAPLEILPAAASTESPFRQAFPDSASLQEPNGADLLQLSKAFETAIKIEPVAQMSMAMEGSQIVLSRLQRSVCGLSVGEALALLRKLKLPWFLVAKRPSLEKDLISMVEGDGDSSVGGARLWAALVRGATDSSADLHDTSQAISLTALLCVGAAAVLWEMEAMSMLISGWSLGLVKAEWSRQLQELKEAYGWIRQKAHLFEAKLGTSIRKPFLPARPVEIDSSAMLTPAVRAAVRDLHVLKSYEKMTVTGDKAKAPSKSTDQDGRRGTGSVREANLDRPLSFETWRSQGPGALVLEALRVKEPPVLRPATPRLSRKPLKTLRCVV